MTDHGLTPEPDQPVEITRGDWQPFGGLTPEQREQFAETTAVKTEAFREMLKTFKRLDSARIRAIPDEHGKALNATSPHDVTLDAFEAARDCVYRMKRYGQVKPRPRGRKNR